MSAADLFKRIKEAKDDNDALIPLIMDHLHTSSETKPYGPESWIGASTVPTLCPRFCVIAYRLKLDLASDIPAKMKWGGDKGTAIHSIIQDQWLGPMGILLGGWRCPKCFYLHGKDKNGEVTFRSSVKIPDSCERCETKRGRWKRFMFVEPTMRRESPYWVSGFSDGLLALPGNAREVLEIKNVSQAGVRYVRERPNDDHVSQLHWYMDDNSYRSGRILYVNLGTTEPEEALFEHKVSFNPAIMTREKEKIRGLREALKNEDRPVPPCPYDGKGPYRTECPCIEVGLRWAYSRPGSFAP